MKILNQLKKALFLLVFVPVIGFSQEKDVIIRIVQDESFKLNDFQTNIKLKKKAFKFQVLLNKMEGLYVFASIKDSIYRYTETSPIYDFSYLKLLELRETDKFNTNKELNISETGWSYWFYNDTTEYHTFSRRAVTIGVNELVAVKVIRQLYDVGEGKTVKFKNITSPLYLFFIAVKEYDKDGKPLTELMRRKVKIEWTDED